MPRLCEELEIYFSILFLIVSAGGVSELRVLGLFGALWGGKLPCNARITCVLQLL